MAELKQLTSLDAQFLAIETDRNYGHVGGLAILDPSTAPGGELTLDDLKQLVLDRLHLVAPFTQRLVSVPFSIDWPYWTQDEHFDIGYHCREIALPEARRAVHNRAAARNMCTAPAPGGGTRVTTSSTPGS